MKRLTSLFLAFLMLLTLISCASESRPNVSSSASDSTTDSTSTDPSIVSGEDDTEAPNSTLPTESTQLITFPLTETFHFSFWAEMATNYMPYASLAEHPAYIELEKRTNVSPDWIHPSATAATEQFSLITASGEYYDVMTRPSSAAMTMTDLYENEIAIDLTMLISTYMPNYSYFINKNDELRKDLSDDSGRMLAVYGLQDQPVLNWWGLGIRQDILEDYGVALPTTYNEWDTALAALKSAGVERPLQLPKSGVFYASNFESGFGVGYDFFLDDNTVKYGPMEDGFLEYLTLMNEWYQKGYIGSNFVGDDERFAGIPTIADLVTGTVGSGVITSSELGGAHAGEMSDDEDFYLAALPNPVKDENSKIWSTSGGSGLLASAFFISTSCTENKIPTILSYFDYLYSEEGAELVSWGVENDAFEWDENGNRKYTDRVNCSSFDGAETFHVYGLTMFQTPGLYNDKERFLGRADEIIEMQSNWTNVGTGFGTLPNLTFTAEESELYSGPAADCSTYATENIARFIIGDRPLSEFEDFRQVLISFGIETALETYQTAYNRYNAR